MSAGRAPEAVGPVAGTVPPPRLPRIGEKVIDHDNSVGVVAEYEYYKRDQVWFPVRFPEPGGVWKTRQRRLGPVASLRGYVRLANPPVSPPLDLARVPER